jgi:hypothetical protein
MNNDDAMMRTVKPSDWDLDGLGKILCIFLIWSSHSQQKLNFLNTDTGDPEKFDPVAFMQRVADETVRIFNNASFFRSKLLISYSLFPIKFSPKMRDLSTKKLWEGQN